LRGQIFCICTLHAFLKINSRDCLSAVSEKILTDVAIEKVLQKFLPQRLVARGTIFPSCARLLMAQPVVIKTVNKF